MNDSENNHNENRNMINNNAYDNSNNYSNIDGSYIAHGSVGRPIFI